MKIAFTIIAALCLLLGCSNAVNLETHLVDQSELKTFSDTSGTVELKIYLHNQSPIIDHLDITVKVNGYPVSSDQYEFQDVHDIKHYTILIPAGEVRIEAESLTGEAKGEWSGEITTNGHLAIGYHYSPPGIREYDKRQFHPRMFIVEWSEKGIKFA